MTESSLKTFWKEVQRRKVVHVAFVYAAVGWIVVEGASVVFPGLLLPDWTQRLVLALVLLGFPIALVLAWAFELSAGRLKREESRAIGDAATGALGRADERRTIAVLPLTNMSGDPENEYFGDGIAEEILNLLARLPQIRVISRTSSFSFRDSKQDVRAIARKLEADMILEGSVRRANRRVRIAAQLIDAASDTHMWSESYDREIEDIFAVQSDIARCIVDAMNLDEDEPLELVATTENVEAYQYYLRGRAYFHQLSAHSLQYALQMFEKAIEIDAGYAKAWAGLADTECMIAQWHDRSEERLITADRASRKALTLAPNLPESHASRGYALSMNGDYEGAAREFERALVLDPGHYDTLYLYGRSRYAEGKLEQAAELWARAHEAQPDEFQSAALRAQIFIKLDQPDKAMAAMREAVSLIERRLALNPDDLRALGLGPAALIYIGRREEGLALNERALIVAGHDHAVLQNAACAYARAGEKDKALKLLERRIELGGVMYREWVEHDPDFDTLRDDPRFIALLERMPSR